MNEGILNYILNSKDNISNEEVQTCLESIGSDLKELDSIDESLESYEKASFESTIENINLLNSVLAERNIKSGVALESVSTEFGISVESLKEAMNKGLATIKAMSKKSMSTIAKFKSNISSNRKLLRNLYTNAKYLDKNTKYDIRTFALALIIEIQLAAVFSKSVNKSDFPSDPALQPALDYAFSNVKKFYDNNGHQLMSKFISKITGIEGDLDVIVGKNTNSKIANSISAPDDFNYHDNAIKLINAFKRYNLEDEINHVLDKVNNAITKINEHNNISDDEKRDLTNMIKTLLSMLQSMKNIYHTAVKCLVTTCNGHKKIDK